MVIKSTARGLFVVYSLSTYETSGSVLEAWDTKAQADMVSDLKQLLSLGRHMLKPQIYSAGKCYLFPNPALLLFVAKCN